jgi:hypothetical protein
VKFAVYTSNGTRPGTLIASTSSGSATVGKLELPSTAALTAGSYWIVFAMSEVSRIGGVSNAGLVRRILPQPFASPFPSTWPSSDLAATGLQFNVYLKSTVP